MCIRDSVGTVHDHRDDRQTGRRSEMHEALLERKEPTVAAPSPLWPDPDAQAVLPDDVGGRPQCGDRVLAILAIEQQVAGELVRPAEEGNARDLLLGHAAAAD